MVEPVTAGLILGGSALAGAGTGALAGLAGAGSRRAAERAAQRAVAKQGIALSRANVENEFTKQRTAAAERASLGVFTGLGAPGTYEQPYEEFAVEGTGTGGGVLTPDVFTSASSSLSGQVTKLQNLFPAGITKKLLKGKYGAFPSVSAVQQALRASNVDPSQFSKEAIQEFLKNPTPGQMQGKKYALRYGGPGQIASLDADVLDPQKYTQTILDSRQGRMVSFLTAQADQLARGEGELYNELQQSILGPVYEGSAAILRESAEDLRKQVARGGSARRQGLAQALELRNREAVNRDRMNAVWNANLTLKQWAIQNAKSQLTFNQGWSQNLAGVRDAFNNTMNTLNQFYANVLLPATEKYADNTFRLAQVRDQGIMSDVIGGIIAGVGVGAQILAPSLLGPSTAATGAGTGLGASNVGATSPYLQTTDPFAAARGLGLYGTSYG